MTEHRAPDPGDGSDPPTYIAWPQRGPGQPAGGYRIVDEEPAARSGARPVPRPAERPSTRGRRRVWRIGLVLLLTSGAGLTAGSLLPGDVGTPEQWWEAAVTFFDPSPPTEGPPAAAVFAEPVLTGSSRDQEPAGSAAGEAVPGEEAAPDVARGAAEGSGFPPGGPATSRATEPGATAGQTPATKAPGQRAPRITIELFPVPADTVPSDLP